MPHFQETSVGDILKHLQTVKKFFGKLNEAYYDEIRFFLEIVLTVSTYIISFHFKYLNDL